jgi:hypothetical protein
LLFLGESTPPSKDDGEVRQMHSPSSILPHFYAAIVKAGSLIKTKRDSFHVVEKKETSWNIVMCGLFFLD